MVLKCEKQFPLLCCKEAQQATQSIRPSPKMSLDEQTACFSAVCRSITVQKRSLLRVAVGQDGRLGDIKVKSSILLQDVLQVSQNLKRYTELSINVSIVSISKRPGQRVLCERTSS
jgi:hypothetical protein